MLHRIRKLRAVEAGFTLIELLIVVVILGVLAGTVVFAVQNFNNDGVQSACRADVKSVEIASEAYYARAVPQGYAANMAALVTAGYLKETPPDGTGPTDKYKVTWAGGGATAPTITGTYGPPAFTTPC